MVRNIVSLFVGVSILYTPLAYSRSHNKLPSHEYVFQIEGNTQALVEAKSGSVDIPSTRFSRRKKGKHIYIASTGTTSQKTNRHGRRK